VTPPIAPGGLTLPPGLHVSFQRYARTRDDAIAQAPSSLGALPVALSASGELVLPVAPDEAFWIGLEAMHSGSRAELAVRFTPPGRHAVDALSGAPWNEQRPTWIAVPPISSIEGIALPADGFRAFVRTPLAREDDSVAVLDLTLRADGAATRLLLVGYARFEKMTGHARPTPLDPESRYKGWLLP
jgi:hypothetical protein